MLKLVHAFDMNFDSVLDYYNSFEDKWHDLNCYAITMVEDGIEKYFDNISRRDKNLYYLVDDVNPDYIIGYGSIEDSDIIDYHLSYMNTGSIGYGVRPSERNKGYGTLILKLLLTECEKLGMYEVCVSCLEKNIASRRIIEKNKGQFEKRFFDDDLCKYGLKYWIKLHPNIILKYRRKRRIKETRTRYRLNY